MRGARSRPLQIRQQSAPPHLDPSTLDVVRSIIRTDGFRGLYRGFTATALRDLGYGPYFCTWVLKLLDQSLLVSVAMSLAGADGGGSCV